MLSSPESFTKRQEVSINVTTLCMLPQSGSLDIPTIFKSALGVFTMISSNFPMNTNISVSAGILDRSVILRRVDSALYGSSSLSVTDNTRSLLPQLRSNCNAMRSAKTPCRIAHPIDSFNFLSHNSIRYSFCSSNFNACSSTSASASCEVISLVCLTKDATRA